MESGSMEKGTSEIGTRSKHSEPGSAGVPSLGLKRTFKEALSDGCAKSPEGSSLAGYVTLPANHLKITEGAGIKTPVMRNGKPAILLSDAELSLLEAPLKLTLIGKFIAGRPRWLTIVKFFKDLKLSGGYKLANIDPKHFVIHLQLEEDYIRIFSRIVFFINGFMMKIFKWNIRFDLNEEPTIVPVWIILPLVGLHLYTPEMLCSIASVIGKPLKLDHATCYWSRPAFARILVELDLKKKFETEVWIGSENAGYMQHIVYENVPSYCHNCRRFGHCDVNCYVLHPELKNQNTINMAMNRIKVLNEDLQIDGVQSDRLCKQRSGDESDQMQRMDCTAERGVVLSNPDEAVALHFQKQGCALSDEAAKSACAMNVLEDVVHVKSLSQQLNSELEDGLYLKSQNQQLDPELEGKEMSHKQMFQA